MVWGLHYVICFNTTVSVCGRTITVVCEGKSIHVLHNIGFHVGDLLYRLLMNVLVIS